VIPDDVITKIRDAASIREVVGQHVQLKRAGRNWKGLCPFHGEKTPSFNVSEDKGFFHCFGCQKHGDVFTFVMELEGKSFVEAAEVLAQRYGIDLPRVEESPELRRARGERSAMLDANKLATAFFRDTLLDPKKGEAGRAYLAKRGVGDDIAAKFQLGYAPADWHTLADHLDDKRVDGEIALKLGLVRRQPRAGGYYDAFRDRLVCPVIVPGGEVAGFSARVIGSPPPGPDGSEPPKYVNSPESAVYKKSRLLFGLAQAREAMARTKRVVLVEGNFDVITLHQAGFDEVVAPLGTALTAEQVMQLKRLTEKVVLLYDGDKAGYKATIHALQLFFEAEVEVMIAKLPRTYGGLSGGADPDSVVAGGNAERLREAIANALSGFEYFCFEVWGRAKANADARARALHDASKIVAKVADPTKRKLIVGTLASALDVSLDIAWSAMGGGAAPNGPRASGPGPRPEVAESGQPPPPTDELDLFVLLADHPSLLASADADRAFRLLTDARLRAMYSAARAGQSFPELATALLPKKTAEHVLSGKHAKLANPAASLATVVAALEIREAKAVRARMDAELKEKSRMGDRERVRELAAVFFLQNQLIDALSQGNRARADELANEISRKQVD
jgi:DNA primase